MLPCISRSSIGGCGSTARAVRFVIEISTSAGQSSNVTDNQNDDRKFSLLPQQVLARELWTEGRQGDMAIAKMSVAELEKFLDAEYPQIFNGGDISIESADGASCLLRQRFSEQMLRPGGTVSGPTLMALADFAMYVVLLSAIGPVGLAVTTNLNINFLRKGQPGQDVLAAARLLKLGKRLAVGEVSLLSGTSPDPIAHVTATYSIPNT
jgi:uncharacterized protein (TIGR00369 family)